MDFSSGLRVTQVLQQRQAIHNIIDEKVETAIEQKCSWFGFRHM